MKKLYFPLLFAIFFSVFGYVESQMPPQIGGATINSNNTIAVSLSPKYPGAKTSTTVTTTAFQINLDKTPITWYVDGEIKLTGVGKKTFTFMTGPVGIPMSIKIVADSSSFGTVTKEFTVTPTDLDILWEADTYTPPFYKGKALPTSKSIIRVVPFPSFIGKEGYYNSEDLVYKWKSGYFANANDSGYGKNTFIYRAGYTYNTDEIETTVSTIDNGMSITKKEYIYVDNPKIVFYENKPMGGIQYGNAIGDSREFENVELTVHAVPYFFSLQGINDNTASFSWRLDGKKLDIDPDNKTEFTFRKPEKGSGRFQLKLDIDNTQFDLQSSSKNLSLSYSN